MEWRWSGDRVGVEWADGWEDGVGTQHGSQREGQDMCGTWGKWDMAKLHRCGQGQGVRWRGGVFASHVACYGSGSVTKCHSADDEDKDEDPCS